MSDKEMRIREEIEKSGGPVGDLRLALAECLIEQEKYAEAWENLHITFDEEDDSASQRAGSLMIDLLLHGHCVELVEPYFICFLFNLYAVDDEDKKRLVIAKAATVTDDSDLAYCIDLYANISGGEEYVAELYRGLGESQLCDLYYSADDGYVKTEIAKALLDRGERQFISDEVFCDMYDGLEVTAALAEYLIEKQDNEALIWLYSENKYERDWDWNEVNETLYAPIIEYILGTEDVSVVSEFIKANEESFGDIYTDLRYAICEFVSNNYLDESGNVRKEWGDLTEVYTMLVDMVFDAQSERDAELTYSDFDKAFVKDAFTACQHYFTDEALEESFGDYDGQIGFSTIYGNVIITEVKDEFLSNLKGALKAVEEKYFY